MLSIDQVILVTGILLLLGVISSKFSARLGVPVLVVFLALGMLAGSEAIGGIEFDNYEIAHGIGSLALAMILLDGGLQTPIASVQDAWRPSLLLATLGVFLTALVTGAAAMLILGLSFFEGLLLGSIVASTDAAAVFNVLRSGGVHLRPQLKSTLEIESGSNDPMAIFLTIGMTEVLLGHVTLGPQLLGMLALQMGVGTIVGLAIGYSTVQLVNRIKLSAVGLYPILVSAAGLLAFGLATLLGGSGFLAIYLAGIVVGNNRIVVRRGILLFHDAGAWLAQIVMFVVLGLLSFPSQVWSVAPQGLAIALVLMFVARPIAVLASLWPFKFSWRELVFIAWVGLKGAVPITLAIFPLLQGIEAGPTLFNVVFFVVLLSALVQGWSLPLAARKLGVEVPPPSEPPVMLEITSLREVDGDIIDYLITEDSRVLGRRVRDLGLPDGVVVALIARAHQIVPPLGNTELLSGDHVFVIMRPDARLPVDRIFSRRTAEVVALPSHAEFPLRGKTTIGQLEEVYGFRLDFASHQTLDEALRERLGPALTEGAAVQVGQIVLTIRILTDGGTIHRVGMMILPEVPVTEAVEEVVEEVEEKGSEEI